MQTLNLKSLAALFVFLTLDAGAARALDLSSVPVKVGTAQDTLRFRARQARHAGDWNQTRSLVEQCIAKFPGDGFALREVVNLYDGEGRLLDLSKQLESHDVGGLPAASRLREADIAYLRGLIEFYRSRFASARLHFDQALERSPGWTWARLYRGRASVELLAPEGEYEPDLQAALDDPDTAPEAISLLATPHERSWPAGIMQHAELLLPQFVGIPWFSGVPDWHAGLRRLSAGKLSTAVCDSLWTALAGEHGVPSSYYAGMMAVHVAMFLPPKEALPFLEARERDQPIVDPWRRYRALLLHDLGYEAEADSLLEAAAQRDPEDLRLLIQFGMLDRSADSLQAWAHLLTKLSFQRADVEIAAAVLRDLGRKDEIKSLDDELRRENPAVLLDRRLRELTAADVSAAKALLDSLASVHAGLRLQADHAPRIAEAQGDTLAANELLDPESHNLAAFTAADLADIALAAGQDARARGLSRRAVSGLTNDFGFLASQSGRAVSAGDKELAHRILDLLKELSPDSPAGIATRVDGLVGMGEHETATAEIERAAASEAFPPSIGSHLAIQAALLGRNDLADRLYARAAGSRPDWCSVRFARAWLDLHASRIESARTTLASLVEEFPGRSSYRYLMMKAGGPVQSLPAFTESEDDVGRQLAAYEHDLVSTDWIKSRMAAVADSFKGNEAVILAVRTSYACERTDRYAVRNRLTLQILAEEALQYYQPMRIPFRPADGAPQIQVARVIHSDGRVTDVKRSDIVVSGSDHENADVSDILQVVIPFPGLAVGDVLDLVHDMGVTATYGSGWSFRNLFGSHVPTMEEILEIRCRKGSCTLYRGNGAPPPVTTTDGNFELYSWQVKQIPSHETEDLSPDVFERKPWIGCTSFHSWESTAERYQSAYWQNVVAPDSMVSLAASLTRNSRTAKDKLQTLNNFVIDRIKYLAIELDRGSVVPTAAPEVLRRGYGDCKDMVTLLIALLGAAGIRAEPVLVAPRPDAATVPEFVEPSGFTHMVAFVPEVGGGMFCDPTNGSRVPGALDAGLGGVTGLVVPRSGPARLITLPPALATEHGFDMQVDVRPHDDQDAEIKISSRYRGDLAGLVRIGVGLADTAAANLFADRSLALGLWGSCRRDSWKIESDDGASIVVSGSYRDTAWSEARETSLRFPFSTEVGDPFLYYPAAKERKTDVTLPHPFHDTVTLRLHGSQMWEPEDDIALMSVKGDFYSGTIEKEIVNRTGEHFVEIRQSFEVKQTEIPLDRYQTFRNDWARFQVGISQPIRYRKTLNESELKRLEAYAAEHPDDFGFALQAVEKILGSDLGGNGEAGSLRRDAARRLLMPIAIPESGAMPCVILAGLQTKVGHYLVADSLLSEAARRDPGNMLVLAIQQGFKREIGDLEGQLDILRTLVRQTGNDELIVPLLSTLIATGREAEGKDVEDRYFALHGDADSTVILGARLEGYAAANDCARAAGVLDGLRSRAPELQFALMESGYYIRCGPISRAIPILERLWSENPVSSIICNNLAWCYALAGRELDRAKELADAAIILADDPSAARNTLGAIHARRSEWGEARAIFSALQEADDRPNHQALNDYFIGLCDYSLGSKQDAISRWQRALELPHVEVRWREAINKSLKIAQEDGSVTDPIFASDAEGSP